MKKVILVIAVTLLTLALSCMGASALYTPIDEIAPLQPWEVNFVDIFSRVAFYVTEEYGYRFPHYIIYDLYPQHEYIYIVFLTQDAYTRLAEFLPDGRIWFDFVSQDVRYFAYNRVDNRFYFYEGVRQHILAYSSHYSHNFSSNLRFQNGSLGFPQFPIYTWYDSYIEFLRRNKASLTTSDRKFLESLIGSNLDNAILTQILHSLFAMMEAYSHGTSAELDKKVDELQNSLNAIGEINETLREETLSNFEQIRQFYSTDVITNNAASMNFGNLLIMTVWNALGSDVQMLLMLGPVLGFALFVIGVGVRRARG